MECRSLGIGGGEERWGEGGGRRQGGRGGREGRGWEDEWRTTEEVQMMKRRQVPRLRDTLEQLRQRDMLPAIWFIFSRRGCDAAVDVLSDVQLLTEEEQEEVRQLASSFQDQFPEAVRAGGMEALCRGVASHHAGCLPLWKGFG